MSKSTSAYLVAGKITNIGDSPAHNIRVMVSFFLEDGMMIDAVETSANPRDLNPQEVANFEASPTYVPQQFISSYDITAESDEYTIVSEFPLTVILILVM